MMPAKRVAQAGHVPFPLTVPLTQFSGTHLLHREYAVRNVSPTSTARELKIGG